MCSPDNTHRSNLLKKPAPLKNTAWSSSVFGNSEDGYIDYVKGANVAGFLKVAKAMMAQGIV
jgi:glutamate dehydrogenase (NADP+)